MKVEKRVWRYLEMRVESQEVIPVDVLEVLVTVRAAMVNPVWKTDGS
jgi:hypothetical protein